MNKNSLKILGIFTAVTSVTFLVCYFSLFTIWQEKVFDKFFTKKAAASQIIIFAIDNESIQSLGQWPWSRQVFANALQKLQSAKTVAIDVNFSEPSKTDPTGDIAFGQAIANSNVKIILPVQINSATKEKLEPLPIFKQNSLLGLVNISSEDGVVRKVKKNQYGFDNFGALVALQENSTLHIPDTLRIDYAGPEKTLTTLPLNDLLQDRIPESVYKNKLVLIGVTAPDLHDTFHTPFGVLSGVEIHANIAGTIINQKFYRELPLAVSLLIILTYNLLTVLFITKIKKFSLLVIFLLVTLMVINIISILLFSFHVIFPLLYVNFGFLASGGTLIIFQYIRESKEKKFIHDSFKYYLSEQVINEIIKDPAKLKLGGERKKITVFFSDVRGFTTMSESMDPETLTYVLSEYMTKMTDIVIENQGLVTQYFGDGIMALWGAPLDDSKQAEHAATSCLNMMQALDRLNERLVKEGIDHKIKIGIGLNTSKIIAGNIGSKKKFNYTAFGDGVNLTSRLESLTKTYGVDIIITDTTKQELEGNSKFMVRELDTIVVKGKKEPKTIFELMQKSMASDVLKNFDQGQKYYKKGDWTKAIKYFSSAAEYDPASKMYLERCRELQQHPPTDWKGVYEFTNK